MKKDSPCLLVVDDDSYNINIISHMLKDESYNISTAKDGLEAINLLEQSPERYDAVLLDRIMPKLDGMDVLGKIKKNKVLKSIPVIFQSSMDKENDILDGLNTGAYYYLTKPYKKKILLAVVRAAITDYACYKSLRDEVSKTFDAIVLMKSGKFEFKTLDQGHKLATLLAKVCPKPNKAVLGLWELFANAVEHGNLGITYQEKSVLNENNQWETEINRRYALPENVEKIVSVSFDSNPEQIIFSIIDQGQGFDWKTYMEFSPDRVFDNHGRGIAMAKMFSFDHIEYKDRGNHVKAVIKR